MNSRNEITWWMATTSELLASDVAGQDDIWKFKISPLLLQASATLLASQFHFVFELHPLSLLLRKVLKTDKAFLCFTGYLLAQSEIPNDVFPCITSEGEWSPRSNGSKLGLFMLPELFSIGIVWKKPCPELELHGKNQRAYHTDLCPGDEGIAPSTSPYHQWMRKVFPFLVRSQDMQPIGGRLVLHQSTSVLNGRLCPQPQWSHPQRKHWAPKHFQAVNSWILLTRGSSNI